MLRLGGGTANFRYWRILLIVIESGMIYSIALIFEITLYFIGSNAFYIVYDPIAQLTVRSSSDQTGSCSLTFDITQAIVPTMILVLAGLELTSNDVHSRITKVSLPAFRPGISVNASDSDDSTPGRRQSYGSYPLEQMRFASPTTTKSDDPTATFKSDKSEYRSSRQFGHVVSVPSARSAQSTNGESFLDHPKSPSSKV